MPFRRTKSHPFQCVRCRTVGLHNPVRLMQPDVAPGYEAQRYRTSELIQGYYIIRMPIPAELMLAR